MLQLSAGSLLALGLWPGALRAAGAGHPGEFTFIVVNDVHYTSDKCGRWLERVLAQIKATKPAPDFLLLAGDYSEDGKPAQLGAMRDLLQGLGLPHYGVIGNHDYESKTSRKPYEDIFPGRLNYHFQHQGWQIVAFDSTEGNLGGGTTVQPATLQWLDDTLPKLDRKLPLLAFTHFPLGPKVNTRSLNADAVLERFKAHNLQATFSGHWHGFTEREVRGAAVVTNRCCSFAKGNFDNTPEKGYFVCRAKDGKITREFVEAPKV